MRHAVVTRQKYERRGGSALRGLAGWRRRRSRDGRHADAMRGQRGAEFPRKRLAFLGADCENWLVCFERVPQAKFSSVLRKISVWNALSAGVDIARANRDHSDDGTEHGRCQDQDRVSTAQFQRTEAARDPRISGEARSITRRDRRSGFHRIPRSFHPGRTTMRNLRHPPHSRTQGGADRRRTPRPRRRPRSTAPAAEVAAS